MKKLLIITLLICCLTACGKKEEDKPINPPSHHDDVVVNKLSFDMVDYTVYSNEELKNRFAIVKVRIKDENPISYNLKDFVTNENINLADYKDYTDELDRKGIVLSKYHVNKEIVSDQNSAIFNLYVPITNEELTECSITFLKEYSIQIDLTQKNQNIVIDYDNEETIIEDKNYQVVVKKVYNTIGEALYEDDEVSYYPASSEIYAIQVLVVSLNNEKVQITRAKYKTSDNEFEALEKRFSTERTTNILEEVITDQKEGYLLFMTFNPEKEPITYKGILKLEINNVWYDVEVDF